MSDSEPPGSGTQPEHDGSFARLRNFLRLIRRPRNGESLRETLDEMIDEPAADDGHQPLSGHERVLIGNILKVHDHTAADVMVPRVDIVSLDIETPFAEVVECMVQQGHSRVPVYRETLDDVIGFIHVKDVLGPVAERKQSCRRCFVRCSLSRHRCRSSTFSFRCARRVPILRWWSTSLVALTGW